MLLSAIKEITRAPATVFRSPYRRQGGFVWPGQHGNPDAADRACRCAGGSLTEIKS